MVNGRIANSAVRLRGRIGDDPHGCSREGNTLRPESKRHDLGRVQPRYGSPAHSESCIVDDYTEDHWDEQGIIGDSAHQLLALSLGQYKSTTQSL
jgi:hypothetical protein